MEGCDAVHPPEDVYKRVMYGPVPLENSACVAGVHTPAKPVCGRHVAGTVVL